MVLVKNFHFSISDKINQEKAFYRILKRKNAFLKYKKRCYKRRKIGIFLKGLVHSFDQKFEIYESLYFGQNRQGKCALRCPRKKKRLTRL